MKTKFLTLGLIAVFTLTSLAQSKEKVTITSYSSLVSISNSNESYKFRARFDKSKTDDVKKILLAKLSNKDSRISKKKHLWVENIGGDDVFKCELTKGKVKISLDKDDVSTSYYNKIRALGNELKALIYGTSSKEDSTYAVKRAEKKLKRAKRNLDRAKKELEKAKKKIN